MSDSSPRNGKGGGGGGTSAPKPSLAIQACQGGLTSMAVSPDGTKIATTSKEGILYVHDLNTGALITGFKVQHTSCRA